GDGARLGVDNVSLFSNAENAYVAFHYISAGTDGGDGRKWIVDNFEFRAKRHSFFSEKFDVESLDEADFMLYSVASNKDWTLEERADQKGVFMNGYGADEASEDWLISPEISVEKEDLVEIIFDMYRKYDGPSLELLISENYSGKGDPNKADWLSYPIDHSDIDDSWKSVVVDLPGPGFSGSGYMAFRYTSTGTGPGDGGRLGVDNVRVVRTPGRGVTEADLTIKVELPEQKPIETEKLAEVEKKEGSAAILPESTKETGAWDIGVNGLSQEDESQYFAKYVIPAPQDEANLIYSFSGKASTEGWKGFGVHILASDSKTAEGYGYGKSYLIWVTKDPEHTNSNSTFVQLYKSFSDSRMEQLVSKAIVGDIGDTVDVKVLVNHVLNTIVVFANGKPVFTFTDKNMIQSGNEIVIRALDKAVFTDGGVFPLK
ncbi:MAG: choice-of-anchor J domain-containing protein, partial [Spirochaetales bacterium]|nr:choice-of-anchor J domain-containing protein [Spirochaetales bacterium]